MLSRAKRMTTIEVRPIRNGWKVFEAPGVEPFFIGPRAKEQALSYARERVRSSGGEVRICNALEASSA